MTMTLRRAIPLLAAVAAITMTSAPVAGTANAANTGPASAAMPGLPVSAAAVTVSNHQVSGIMAAISCLTRSRCVAVGYGKHRGQVVVLVNGRQAGVSYVPAGLFSVSCPSRSGCWAIGVRKGGADLVQLSRAGKVTRQITAKVPSSVSLLQISCVTMTSCEIVGDNPSIVGNFNLGTIEVASWNGKKLKVTNAGTAGAIVYGEGTSCWQTNCVVVGTVQLDSTTAAGFILTIKRGKPGKLNLTKLKRDFLVAVSCVSSSTCYAASSDGFVVTLKNGVAGFEQSEPVGLTSIECAGATCRAVGQNVIFTLTNGVATGSSVVDKAVSGFRGPNCIARRGNGFAAIGSAHTRGASEVVTG
jgi:hypothetical protein